MATTWAIKHFNDLSTTLGQAPHSLELAEYFDKEDSLAKYRNEFSIPIRRNVSGDAPHNGRIFKKKKGNEKKKRELSGTLVRGETILIIIILTSPFFFIYLSTMTIKHNKQIFLSF